MLAEKIIFNLLAVTLFILIFFKMIRKNDTNYVFILCLEALGIGINFIEIVFNIDIGIVFRLITYLLAIILPLAIFVVEYKGMNFSELLYIFLAKFIKVLGNRKKAKSMLLSLISKYPESYLAHKMLAEIYESEGGMRKAIDEYVKAIDINKKDYKSYYKIASLLNELGSKNEAMEMLTTLVKKKPEYTEASMSLGDLLCEQEMYKEALNAFTAVLKYRPNDYDVYYNMGIVYTMLNDFANAKLCYERAAEINTLLYNAYYNIAQINLILGDLDEAEKYFMQSIENKDVESHAYYNLAKIYMLKDDKENAIKFVNLAIDLDYKNYKKAEAEPIFIPIKSHINFPVIDEDEIEEEKETKLSGKEIKVIKHLDETYKIVGKLSYNELKLNKDIFKEEVEDQREKE